MATPVNRNAGYPGPGPGGGPGPPPSAGPPVQSHIPNLVPQNIVPLPQVMSGPMSGPISSAPVQQGPPHQGVIPGPGMIPQVGPQGMPPQQQPVPSMPSQVPSQIPPMGQNIPPANIPPAGMVPSMSPMGPGMPAMRPHQIPPQMQHVPPPQGRQYGVPPGYQGSVPRPGYSPGPGMQGTPPPHQRVNQSMPPPPIPYTPGRMPPQGGMPMDSRKRPPDRIPDGRAMMGPKGGYMSTFDCRSGGPPGQQMPGGSPSSSSKKKKKLADKILPQKVRDLVPESQAYMDLLAFERKLDFTIMRKRLDIQEALKRPQKQKRKLRIFISNTFYPAKPEGDGNEEPTVPSWELRVEGRLLDDPSAPKADQSKGKRKFSSFFKSLVIELDKDLYGPDNHLVEWHRTPTTTETDGFQVKRPGDKNVRCTILLLLDYQPLQFKLDSRLARLLGIHTQTRPMIINALWQYIKTHKLQDPHEREYVNCDKYLEQIFQCPRMKFAEIPQRLHQLLHPPDPIVINHIISVEGPDTKKTACYDIDVEVDDPLKLQMNNFLLSTASQQEIQGLDNKIHETVETINQLKTNREFFLSFAKDPQQFIDKWLISQTKDLKTMTDVVGNPEEERRSDFYYQPWSQEAVCRYFYGKVQQRRAELEQALGIRNT